MGLKRLRLENNNYSEEALKHVYALLWADVEICVEINAPVKKEDKKGDANGNGDVDEQKK